jgi:hypothetical protein
VALYYAGQPTQNGLVVIFNGRMRDELFNETLFFTVRQARLARWVDDFNNERPHSSLGYATPAAFAAELEKQRAGLNPPVAHMRSCATTTVGLWLPLVKGRGSNQVRSTLWQPSPGGYESRLIKPLPIICRNASIVCRPERYVDSSNSTYA